MFAHLISATLLALASAENLFVSHYDGHVFSLDLDTDASSLTLTQSLLACGGMPSWLTFDAGTRTLYCVDESGTSANVGNGSLSSFHVSPGGALQVEVANVTNLPGGVASVIYEGLGGKKYMAIAH
jgi:6-phosphogluconolactonase (cycloisomerase 2 family)